MSLNCQAERARNSRLDVLYTYTFTSVDIMSKSNFTSGNVALNQPQFVPFVHCNHIKIKEQRVNFNGYKLSIITKKKQICNILTFKVKKKL